MYQYITESGSPKRYNCPYCNHRAIRTELANHIDDEHSEMIPEEFTANRIVFNIANKKDFGTCIQCSEVTNWNESTLRYERLCDSKKCYEDYAAGFKKNMVNTYGVEHRLDDPEVQKLMLKNRRISGEYKFSDGGIRDYCGSYEKKLLEFYDKVLNVPSKDIITPGPIVEYEFEGKMLKWITDIYYVPFNLVHDVKDGGDNPNNRQMDEYRAKQDAKEVSISQMNKYNYIRLTDNNFKQLLSILLEMKETIMNNTKEMIIRIHESNPVIIPYYNNQSLVGIALSESRSLENVYIVEDLQIKKTNATFFKEYSYEVYEYNKKLNIDELLNNINISDPFGAYQELSTVLYDSRQIQYDPMFTKVMDIYEEASIKNNIIESSLINAIKTEPMLEYTEYTNINEKYTNIGILSTMSGYIAYNIHSNKSSVVYKEITDISDSVLSVLNTI